MAEWSKARRTSAIRRTKRWGARSGYVILTGLFIGLGGILGYLPFIVSWIPAAAIAPILVYIGLEVISQAFLATPARHGLAVAVSLLPSLAFLIALEVTAALGAAGAQRSAVDMAMWAKRFAR